MKPLLLLDVDGVLAPLTRNPPKGDFNLHVLEGEDVWLSPTHGVWLHHLSQIFDLVWATTWEHEVAFVEKVLGLPSLPVIEFSLGSVWTRLKGATTWKLRNVEEHVEDRPLAWVDDELYSDAFQWAKRRNSPTLLVRPNPAHGLTYEQCATLEDFGVRVGAQMAPGGSDTPATPIVFPSGTDTAACRGGFGSGR